MMHAIKGGWVGQTFALATCNDSGGKKSRIRRSKEERKAMVESFIKKYQNSNSGNFPSLNLTHKEVGGSFYTVREIVREIIQENRVLGPAKFSLEEQSDDNLLAHYSFCSISIEAQRSLSPPDETNNISHTFSKQNQGSGEELVNGAIETVKDGIGSDEHSITEAATYPHEGTGDEYLPNLSWQFPGPDCQEFDSELIGNVSQPIGEDEESNEPILSSPVSIPHPRITQEHRRETSGEQVLHSSRDFPGHEHLKSDSEQDVNGISWAIGENDEYGLPVLTMAVGEDSLDVEKGGTKTHESSNAGTTRPKADLLVENFPIHPVAKKFDGLEGRSEEQSQETRLLEVNGIEQERVQVLEGSSSVVNVEVAADLAGPSLKKKSEPVDKTTGLNDGNPSLEMSNCSTTKKVIVLDIKNVAEIGAKVSSPIEAKSVNATPNGINENLNNINTSVSPEQSIPDETTGLIDKLNIELDNSSKKGSNSTLDRINLETWERTSEKPAESEINPVLALFKAFVTALVKFWTE